MATNHLTIMDARQPLQFESRRSEAWNFISHAVVPASAVYLSGPACVLFLFCTWTATLEQLTAGTRPHLKVSWMGQTISSEQENFPFFWY